MFCSNCGSKTAENDSFCSKCGKSLVPNTETELLSFGPWGTGISNSHPTFTTIIQKNNTKITLTNNTITGYSTHNNKKRFQIPYDNIVATETYDYMLWKVLWIKYQDQQKTTEVSIMGTLTNHQNIAEANNIIKTHKKQ
jgi:hypothetical protein